MSSVLDELVQIDVLRAYQILNRVAESEKKIQIKIAGEQKILSTVILKLGFRKHFYVKEKFFEFESLPEITIKIISDNRLFLLKTKIKKSDEVYYFDNCEHLYELVRRRRPRYTIPESWAQSATIQSMKKTNELRTQVQILEMSKTGLRLQVEAELPIYEKGQHINLKFKLHRRAELLIEAEIMHLKKSKQGATTIGVQFRDDSVLIKNRIQNICDDLAFHYTAESSA